MELSVKKSRNLISELYAYQPVTRDEQFFNYKKIYTGNLNLLNMTEKVWITKKC